MILSVSALPSSSSTPLLCRKPAALLPSPSPSLLRIPSFSPLLSSSYSSSSRLCSLPFSPSSSSPLSLALRSTAFRRSISPFVLSSLHLNAMAELVKDKEVVASGFAEHDGADNTNDDNDSHKLPHSRTFLDATTEQELLSGIRKEAEAGRLPSNVAEGMEELYHNYRSAVLQSGVPRAEEVVLSNMAAVLDRVLLDVEDPFVFAPYHKALREPFDYYNFGQNYIRPLIDFRNSYVGNISVFNEIEERLQQRHNIVLISNHQTEADPAIIALLLETTHPRIAEKLIYVAGDRVITDPLCKPFSMGRNLICVYSKKHMFDDPELAEMKKKANIRSLKEMAMLLRGGSQIVWIAPSGGRDRRHPQTGEWSPAPFDASSVDNMRRLADHSGAPGHVYPLALLCHDIMPPPPQVEKEIGEKRVVSFHGAGLSIASEIRFSETAAGHENPDEAKESYTKVLYKSVTEQYNVLKSAIHGGRGSEASIPTVSLTQPWN